MGCNIERTSAIREVIVASRRRLAEGTNVPEAVGVDAGGSAPISADVDDMALFADRLAASGSDRPTKLAAAQIRLHIDAGATPPGLRKLAEGLVATAGEPPGQRRPVDDARSVVEAMDVRNLVILDDHELAEVAAAVAALLAGGRRVIVTGPAPAPLAAVRSALPADLADRVVAALPDVLPAELRELRRLLVTETPARRARPQQQLPAASAVPPVAEVAALCARAAGVTAVRHEGTLAELLVDLPAERLDAVTSVARCVRSKLDRLGPHHARSWTWNLLGDLVFQRHRTTFDRLRQEVAQAIETAAAIVDGPPVKFVEPLGIDAVRTLSIYLGYLEDGGRPRALFRTAEQRDVQPVLSRLRVAGQLPETAAEIALILQHRRLADRMERIEKYCVEINIPPLCNAGDLAPLMDDLTNVAAAARSMAALRHDVLFLRADSPIPPPDVFEADQVAAEILAYVERSPGVAAGQALVELADALAATAPATATAPEHEQAVDALRAHDASAFAAAVDALAAARREAHDAERQAMLLSRLRTDAPDLAAAWSAPGNGPADHGLACFQAVEPLLSALPPADSADVVVVLGGAQLGVERLLLTAVAPRMIVTVEPGTSSDNGPSLLAVLRKAGALVIRGNAVNARVVTLPRPEPAPREANVG